LKKKQDAQAQLMRQKHKSDEFAKGLQDEIQRIKAQKVQYLLAVTSRKLVLYSLALLIVFFFLFRFNFKIRLNRNPNNLGYGKLHAKKKFSR